MDTSLINLITSEQAKECAPEIFWSKIKFGEINECWEWQAAKNEKGYGRFFTSINVNRKWLYPHRLMYEKIFGIFDKKLCVCHKCDNPPCCNPNHFFLGTYRDNVDDKMRKGRLKYGTSIGSKNGCAKLNEEKVREIKIRLLNHEKQRDIADIYGVHHAVIQRIGANKKWKHVTI